MVTFGETAMLLPRPLLIPFLSLLLLGGCSMGRSVPSGNESSTFPAQDEVRARSEAFHAFIVGSLYANKGDFAKAVHYFEKTADRLDGKLSPLFHHRLAELFVVAGDKMAALEHTNAALDQISAALGANPQAKDEASVGLAPVRRELLLLKAGILISLDNEKEAQQLYLQVQSEYPGDFDSLYLAFDHSVRNNELQGSRNLLQNYSAKNPTDFLGYFLQGIHSEMSGNYRDAKSMLNRARTLAPDSSSIVLALARTYLRLESFKQARDLYKELLDDSPEDVTLRNIYLALGQESLDPTLVKAMLAHTEMWESDESESRFFLAELLLRKGDLRRATHELYLILLKDPDFGKAHYRLASVFASLGSRSDAVRELKRIKKDSPLYVKSRVFATVLERQLKNASAAEELIREALREERDNLQILLYLIDILKEAGRFDEAENVIKNALETHPESGRLIYDYAMLLHVMKRQQEARNLMWRVLDEDPDHHPALNYLAYSMADADDDLQQALQMSKKAVASQPENGYYLDTLGWIQFKLGNYEESARVLEQAAARVPQDGVIMEHFGDVLVKLERLDMAIEVLRKALAAFEVERDQGTLDDTEALQRVTDKINRYRK